MRVLALDTTTRSGSVALLVDDHVVAERAGDAVRSQAERLPHELVALAHAHGLTLTDIDLFAVASGPGSFTGLRIGIATIQGLAFVHQRRIAGVSALEAAAHAASVDAPPGTHVAAWMNAQRGEVFTALYAVSTAAPFDPARLITVEPATVGTPADVIRRWTGTLTRGAIFVGDGAVMYADTIASGVADARHAGAPLLAGAIGRLGVAQSASGATVGAAGLQPLYVRRPDVELARDRTR